VRHTMSDISSGMHDKQCNMLLDAPFKPHCRLTKFMRMRSQHQEKGLPAFLGGGSAGDDEDDITSLFYKMRVSSGRVLEDHVFLHCGSSAPHRRQCVGRVLGFRFLQVIANEPWYVICIVKSLSLCMQLV
jgi:hypothetical protein